MTNSSRLDVLAVDVDDASRARLEQALGPGFGVVPVMPSQVEPSVRARNPHAIVTGRAYVRAALFPTWRVRQFVGAPRIVVMGETRPRFGLGWMGLQWHARTPERAADAVQLPEDAFYRWQHPRLSTACVLGFVVLQWVWIGWMVAAHARLIEWEALPIVAIPVWLAAMLGLQTAGIALSPSSWWWKRRCLTWWTIAMSSVAIALAILMALFSTR